jgi:antitoxin component YwqK of YwqJK toxin-antitoxin module
MKKAAFSLLLVLLTLTNYAQTNDIEKMVFLAKLSAREATLFNVKLKDRELKSNMFKELKENDTLFYPNKTILRISQVKDNQLNGKMLYYFENGSLAVEFPYKDNQLTDTVKSYYLNGKIEKLGPTKKGKIYKQINYSESGDFIEEMKAYNGPKDNKHFDYLEFETKG